MNDTTTQTLHLTIATDLADVSAEEWDALDPSGNPFVSYAWLRAMEVTGCVAPEKGWMPQHLLVRLDGVLVGACPAYVKGHSYGEYIYDWAWADLAQRLRRAYYPKLILASPFSPVTGPRLRVSPDVDDELADTVRVAMLSTLKSLCRPDALCGVHALFVDEAESKVFDREGYFVRTAHQYHWLNDGYASFDEFLERFRSKRRREIRRERRIVRDAGYHVEVVRGTDFTPDMVDDLVAFYEKTCSRYMYGQQYLNRDFFEEVAATMPSAIRAFFAVNEDGKRVAGTFNLASPTRLYGRYWGFHEDVPHLHFETCYYSMIETAIAEGFDVIEPGAGGDHKYTRGFTPVTMYSAHELTDPQLRMLLERHVEGERDAVGVMIDEMKERGPLK